MDQQQQSKSTPASGRSRLRVVLALALPIIAGMASQNVLNLVDTAMVGAVGPTARAAVGIGGFASFMAVAAITGLSIGVQAMAARRTGEGRLAVAAVPLNGGLLLALVLALPLSALLIWQAPVFFPYLNADPAVIAAGVPYVQARLVCMVAVGMNFAFRGYWNGVGRSMIYMRTLLVMNAANVVFNYVLIFGKFGFPALGALGAGIGTSAATILGTIYYLYLGLSHARGNGFLAAWPDREGLWTMLRLAVPTSIQQFFFAAGFTLLFWIIGRIGTLEVAVSNVLVNLALVLILPGLALGFAAASLVGQALGRGEPEDARRWAWDVVKVALAVMGVLALPMILMPDLILAAFLHQPETVTLGRLPLRIVGAMALIDAVGMVLLHALSGAGATRQTMVVSVSIQWFLFLPAAWLAGPVLGLGLVGIWSCFIAYRALQAAVLVALWRRGRWARIKL
jgi:putative MATE family efflux protein